jgi:predicted HicB family RNase H-like nuclease
MRGVQSQLHIRLSEVLHRKVRVRAAETDKTIQDWVVEAIEKELRSQTRARSDRERDSNG